MRSAYYTKTEDAGISTLVPHARDMTVAAITDSTLAVLNLFPDIVVVIGGGGRRVLRGGDHSSPCLHDDEATISISIQMQEIIDADRDTADTKRV